MSVGVTPAEASAASMQLLGRPDDRACFAPSGPHISAVDIRRRPERSSGSAVFTRARIPPPSIRISWSLSETHSGGLRRQKTA